MMLAFPVTCVPARTMCPEQRVCSRRPSHGGPTSQLVSRHPMWLEGAHTGLDRGLFGYNLLLECDVIFLSLLFLPFPSSNLPKSARTSVDPFTFMPSDTSVPCYWWWVHSGPLSRKPSPIPSCSRSGYVWSQKTS